MNSYIRGAIEQPQGSTALGRRVRAKHVMDFKRVDAFYGAKPNAFFLQIRRNRAEGGEVGEVFYDNINIQSTSTPSHPFRVGGFEDVRGFSRSTSLPGGDLVDG